MKHVLYSTFIDNAWIITLFDDVENTISTQKITEAQASKELR
jgi:hypothetical protein